MLETHEILARIIPDKHIKAVAKRLRLSEFTVYRWRRDDEPPTGTGSRNPLDIAIELLEYAFLHAPAEAHLIPQLFQQRYEQLIAVQKAATSPEELDRLLAQANSEMAEYVCAMIEKLPSEICRKEWEEARIAGERAVRAREEAA
jgi:hypothetical protein